jgi:hypothetical protein
MKILLCLSALCVVLGCGYAPDTHISDARTIFIPIFENYTLWRGFEFELTNVVHNAVLAHFPNYRIVTDPAKSDMVLKGEILGISKPVLVEGDLGATIQSQVVINVRVVLKESKSDKIIYKGEKAESGEMVGQRAENEDTAKVKVYEKLARWITTILEID